MTATLDGSTGATRVTPLLDFVVIKRRAGEILDVPEARVTDVALAEMFGLRRETIWRFRSGVLKPSLPTALAMAKTLGCTVEEITQGED